MVMRMLGEEEEEVVVVLEVMAEGDMVYVMIMM